MKDGGRTPLRQVVENCAQGQQFAQVPEARVSEVDLQVPVVRAVDRELLMPNSVLM